MEPIGTGLALVGVDGHRADVHLNRPEQRNALNRDLLADLTAAFETVRATEDVRAVALLGEGPVLCAGMDLAMMAGATPAEHADIARELRTLFDTIDDFPHPVVAGIEGAALAGGFELTLPCDLRVIGAGAQYGVIEVRLGLFPYGGTTQRLPRLVGLGRAKELVLTGEPVAPDDAQAMGLVTEVVPDGAVGDRARALADELTARSPLGLTGALQAFGHAFDAPLDTGLDLEAELGVALHHTADRDEGFTAHREGREPVFEGR